MTVVVDTNVLLEYLMVIQKFVADIERTEWPSVVVIPSVVISELDWCVRWPHSWAFVFQPPPVSIKVSPVVIGRKTRGRAYRGPPVPRLGGFWTS